MTRRVGAASLAVVFALLAGGCGGAASEVDCAPVTIDAVSSTVAEVPGYAFLFEGTDQVAQTVIQDRTLAYEYDTAPVRGEGAYAAPDRGRVTIDEAMLAPPPYRSSVFTDAWPPYADGYVQVGDRTWLHRQGLEAYYQADLAYQFAANTLEGVLMGTSFRIQVVGGGQDGTAWADQMRWTVERDGGSCRLVGTMIPLTSPLPSSSQAVHVVATVDPATMLPGNVTLSVDLPWSQLGRSEDFDHRYELTYEFEYEPIPEITPPGNVGPEPTLEA
jgi:hypothetical protein